MSVLSELCDRLAPPDRQLLLNVERGMGITADLSRSDLLLLCPCDDRQLVVAAQAQPHSISSLYANRIVGQRLRAQAYPAVFDAWLRRRHMQSHRDLIPSGAPVVQELLPVTGPEGQVVALLSIEISLIQLERHRRRHVSFRQAIEWLKWMCISGEAAAASSLSPFTEWDGILLVDPQRRITYLSGIATNLYRRLGYMDDLRGRRLSFLNTADDELAAQALSARQAFETERQEGSLTWVRKVMPVWGPPDVRARLREVLAPRRPGETRGVLIMVHDATEERRKRQELKVKTTMIQEVHHRVKNNLQTVAAMLRMQARRTEDADALLAINEATSRILSVAVIHEFLSRDELQAINMRDVCQRIVTQVSQVAVSPGNEISFALDGPSIYLPSQQATACALVINELIQNALEHGFENTARGMVRVSLVDGGDQVSIEVWDDGDRLPEDFDLGKTPSLGLQIIRTLVQDDLHGSLTLANHESGVVATVQFPKSAVVQD